MEMDCALSRVQTGGYNVTVNEIIEVLFLHDEIQAMPIVRKSALEELEKCAVRILILQI